MLTARDLSVVEFLDDFRIARTSVVARLFYPSYKVAARRLVELVKAKEVKREREGVSYEYVYYVKRPKQLRHALTLTDTYAMFALQYEIHTFSIEPDFGEIRPDALMVYIKDKKPVAAFIEIELSNKGFDAGKYARFDWQKYFPVRPELIIVTDKKIPSTDYKTTAYPTDIWGIINTEKEAFK